MDIFDPLLTSREKEITTLVAKGLSNDDIASRCFITNRTVEDYLHKIYCAVNVKNRAALIIFYLNNPDFFQLTGKIKSFSLSLISKICLSKIEKDFMLILAKNSLSITSRGTNVSELAVNMELTRKQVGIYLQRLSRRRLIFSAFETRRDKLWYPSIVGLALLRSSN